MKIEKFEDLYKLDKSYRRRSLLKCGFGSMMTLTKIMLQIRAISDLTVISYSIFPQLTRVWYYFMRRCLKYLDESGIKSNILVVDSSGDLQAGDFPDAIVVRFANLYHGTKSDLFIRRYIGSKLVWVSDDDVFILNPKVAVEAVEAFHADTNLAVFSFKPRDWWHFEINGCKIEPMGSYCLMLDRDIMVKEKLYFRTLGSNPHSGKGYDVADFMNEQLLRRGYKVKILDEPKKVDVSGFNGSSIAKILEFGSSKEDLTDYFSSPFSYGGHFKTNLKSFYISNKVSYIHKKLFGAGFITVFTEDELKIFVDRIRDENVKQGILRDFAAIDESQRRILEAI